MRQADISICSNNQGSVDLYLLLIFILIFQCAHYQIYRQLTHHQEQNYKQLTAGLLEFESGTQLLAAWGEELPIPWPRLDYGAYLYKESDSWALCYLSRVRDCPNTLKNLDCAARF